MTGWDAYFMFQNLRANAEKKKVPWNLTFRDFLDIWAEKIDERGQGRLQLQRVVKEDGYVPGNLRIGEAPRAGMSQSAAEDPGAMPSASSCASSRSTVWTSSSIVPGSQTARNSR